ncbi:MAG: sugar ABC transporter permease, partial [Eubacterium sp.]|nr:sugar ABC transporter permease [Eubacterium sp.]
MKASKKKASTVQKKTNLRVYMRRYWQLYVLLLLPMIYLIVFKYVPMVYIQIAFKKYSIVESVWTMPWADNHGFEYFIKAFKNRDFINALRNTLVLNLLDLVIGFPAPIIFALILNELVFKKFKRVVQTIAYMPHFLSWVIIYGLALQIFAPSTGFINMILSNLGLNTVPFLNDSKHWVATYIFLGVWQSF